MNNYNYPVGSDNSTAPWNQEEIEPKDIEVTISITLSKTVVLSVDDYTNLAGETDYFNCNLNKAAKEQLFLPQDAGTIIQSIADGKNKIHLQAIANDLSNWCVDEMEVIPN